MKVRKARGLSGVVFVFVLLCFIVCLFYFYCFVFTSSIKKVWGQESKSSFPHNIQKSLPTIRTALKKKDCLSH